MGLGILAQPGLNMSLGTTEEVALTPEFHLVVLRRSLLVPPLSVTSKLVDGNSNAVLFIAVDSKSDIVFNCNREVVDIYSTCFI